MGNKRIEQLENNCSNVYNKNVWDILELEDYQEPYASCENYSKWRKEKLN